jgi:hypothetical protein
MYAYYDEQENEDSISVSAFSETSVLSALSAFSSDDEFNGVGAEPPTPSPQASPRYRSGSDSGSGPNAISQRSKLGLRIDTSTTVRTNDFPNRRRCAVADCSELRSPHARHYCPQHSQDMSLPILSPKSPPLLASPSHARHHSRKNSGRHGRKRSARRSPLHSPGVPKNITMAFPIPDATEAAAAAAARRRPSQVNAAPQLSSPRVRRCAIADCNEPRSAASRVYCTFHAPSQAKHDAAKTIQRIFRGHSTRKITDQMYVDLILEQEHKRELDDAALLKKVDSKLDILAKEARVERRATLTRFAAFQMDNCARVLQYAMRWRSKARLNVQKRNEQEQGQEISTTDYDIDDDSSY